MKIIEQSHEIISLPDNLLQMIEVAGRTCYKSEDKIGCTGPLDSVKEPIAVCGRILTRTYRDCGQTNCGHHSSQKFTQMLLDRGHHAMIEFGDIIVRFITSRGVTHELVRHRLFSFAQESTRYVRYDGKMEFIRPVWIKAEISFGGKSLKDSTKEFLNEVATNDTWCFAMEQAERDYRYLLTNGWRPEQAREVLPNSLKTEIVVKGNIREWRHCLTLRTSKKAHPQMRALMLPLLTELKEKVPVVFDDISAYTV